MPSSPVLLVEPQSNGDGVDRDISCEDDRHTSRPGCSKTGDFAFTDDMAADAGVLAVAFRRADDLKEISRYFNQKGHTASQCPASV